MQTQVAPLKLSNQPFDRYARMRRESPVFYDIEQQCWNVLGYEDVKNVFANWQLFSSKVPHPPEQYVAFLHRCIAGQTTQILTHEQQAQLEKFISRRI